MEPEVAFDKGPAYGILQQYQSILHWMLFDTEEMDQDTEVINFFANTVGQPFSITTADKKKQYHTNMSTANQIPGDQAFRIHRIHIGMVYNRKNTDSALDLYEAIHAESTLRIFIQDRKMLDIPAKYIGEDNGPNPDIEADNSALPYLQEYIKNGDNSIFSAFTLKKPIDLPGKNTFLVNLLVGNKPLAALTVAHKVLISLEGYLGRPAAQ